MEIMEMETAEDATVGSEAQNASLEGGRNLLEVACALRDMLNDLIGGTGEARGMRAVLEFAAQHLVFSQQNSPASTKNLVLATTGTREIAVADGLQICGDSHSQYVAGIEPTRWSALATEVVQLVIARLPLPQLISRRHYSLKWNWDVDLGDPEFRRVCAQHHPNLFALLVPGSDVGIHMETIYDAESGTWQTFRLRIGDNSFNTMNAGDGGLVCFISTLKNRNNPNTSPLILVVNPLTQYCRVLPHPSACTGQPRMVQLVMDRDTKRYRVTLVGQGNDACAGLLEAEVFDSVTGMWSNAEKSSDLVFGLQYHWETCDESIIHVGSIVGPCAYDCGTQRLLELNDDHSNPCYGASVEDYALVGDHLFVLHVVARDVEQHPDFDPLYYDMNEDEDDPGIYNISVYRGQKDGGPSWMKLQDLPLDEYVQFELPYNRYSVRLFACKGYLLVVANKSAWLYNLSSHDWLELPELRDGRLGATSSDMMCELQWDAVP